MSIGENIRRLKAEIPKNVKLIAVSKTKSVAEIQEAYDAGQKIFGENKAQEMASKHLLLPSDIVWHFIGHLQTNKVRQIAPFVGCIESVDSFHLLREVNKEAGRHGRVIECLLQMYIAREETKFGLEREEAQEILGSAEFREMQNVSITGVMGMATFTCETEIIRKEFRSLNEHFHFLKEQFFSRSAAFREISMGMSMDYLAAIEEGSTMVRIGTLIFGERNYT